MKKNPYKVGVKGIYRHDIHILPKLVKGGLSNQMLFEQSPE